mmetsp:Transcript_16780/g.29432  ORF Transcript_16780/g.29432 Transcript_16780/m.29432 type:complete len:131 (-) Transcript_16780:220-612(-)
MAPLVLLLLPLVFAAKAPLGSPDVNETALTSEELLEHRRIMEDTKLVKAGTPHMTGAWLYGDYINDLEATHDPVGCATACEADPKCYHWNFHVEKKRCDLKKNNGGFNEDIIDWLSGHATRYKAEEAEDL